MNEAEAEIVREIYSLFLTGLTPHTIAKRLTERGIKTPAGKDKWHSSTVKSILTNEKYKGDALLQKTYTSDFLTKKKKINHGEIPMYYVEGSHEGIVTPEIFEAVQVEMERRQSQKSRYSGVDILAAKLVCGECGCFYSPKVWHSTTTHDRVWKCCRKNIHIYEDDLYDAIRRIWSKLTGIRATLLDFDDLTLILGSVTFHPGGTLVFRFVDGSRKSVKISR